MAAYSTVGDGEHIDYRLTPLTSQGDPTLSESIHFVHVDLQI